MQDMRECRGGKDDRRPATVPPGNGANGSPGAGVVMEGFGGQGDTISTPAPMTARILNDARRVWGNEIEVPVPERCAEEAFAELRRDSIKVRTFVPVLALRQIRDMLDQRSPAPADGDPAR